MISIVCFIVPMLLYIITFPLKAIIVTLQIKDKLEAMKERERQGGGSLLSRIENWADNDDGQLERSMVGGAKKTAKLGKDAVVGSAKLAKNTVKYTYKAGKLVYNTGKVAYKTAKFAVKATKFAVRATRIAIKATIATIKFIIITIKSLVVALVALGTVGIVILIVLCIVLIAVIVVTVCIPKITESQETSSSANGGFNGYDYLSIDWSQDFTAKLSEIQSTYGAKNKQHAELVVLNMRTLQENKNLTLDPATWVGIKRVESGTEVLTDDSQSVFTNYSEVEAKPNPWNCSGPYQINLSDSATAWTLFNAKYTPTGTAPSYYPNRDGTFGNVYFYPDLCLGTNTAYSKDLTAWLSNSTGSRGYNGILDDLKADFADLGVAYDDAKGKKVLEFLLANSYNEGSVKSLKSNPHMTVVKLAIEFFNTYGWERSEKHISLIKSCINTSSGGEEKNIYVSADPQTTWLWGANASTASNSMDVGVLDKDSKAISKSLYGYLSDGNESLKSGIGTFPTDNESINSARTYYGIACYFVGTWEIEKTIDYLGLRSQLKTSGGSGDSDGTVLGIIDRECKAMPPNRIEYQQGGAGADDAYRSDCSRFVARVLAEAGSTAFGLKPESHVGFTAHDDFHEVIAECGGNVWTGNEKSWIKANATQAIIHNDDNSELDVSKLQAGDVCYVGSGDSHHVFFYMGENSKGVKRVAHASTTGGVNCSTDMEGENKGYSVGYENFDYYSGQITLVFRPSLIK